MARQSVILNKRGPLSPARWTATIQTFVELTQRLPEAAIREALLLAAPYDPRAHRALVSFSKREPGTTVARYLLSQDIGLADFARMVERWAIMMNRVHAALQSTALIEQIAADAATIRRPCLTCAATGKIDICTTCKGNGKRRQHMSRGKKPTTDPLDCYTCQGTGHIAEYYCPDCHGSGEIIAQAGSGADRDRLLNLGGLVAKTTSPAVAVDISVTSPAAPTADEILRRVAAATAGHGPVITVQSGQSVQSILPEATPSDTQETTDDNDPHPDDRP